MCDEYEYTSEDIQRELTTYMEFVVTASYRDVEKN